MTADIGTCLSYGFEKLKSNPVYMIVGILLIAVVNSASGGLLAGPMMVGFMRGLMKEDRGQPAEIGDLFSGFSDFVPALIGALLGGVAVAIGYFLCIVPGLIIAPILPLTMYQIAAGEKDGIAALKKSWELIQKNMVGLALTMFVVALVGGLGSIACGIGVLATIPIAMAGLYKMAQTTVGTPTSPQGAAPMGPPMGPPVGPPR